MQAGNGEPAEFPGEGQPIPFGESTPRRLAQARHEYYPQMPGPMAMPLSLRSGPDGAALLKALRRRWFLAATLGIALAAAAAGTAYSLVPPKYTAEAVLRVGANEKPILGASSGVNGADYTIYQKTQAGLIKSRFVILAALRQPSMSTLGLESKYPDPVSYLEEELKAEFQEGSEILKLSLSGDMPEELATIVNAVKDAYLKEIVNKEREQKKERHDKLVQIKNTSERLLRSKRAELDSLVQTLKTSDPKVASEIQKQSYSDYAEVQREHRRVESELRKAKLRLLAQQTRLKSLDNFEIPEADLDEQLSKDQALQQYESRIERLQARVKHLEEIVVRPDEPSLVRARSDLKAAEASLAEHRTKQKKGLAEAVRKRLRTEVGASIAELSSEIAELTEDEKVLRDKVDNRTKETEKVRPSSVELEMMQAMVLQDSKVLETVADQLAKSEIELQNSARVELLQPADVPRKRDVKKQLAVTALAGLGTLGLVVFGIAWFEFRTRRIDTVDEVQHGLGMRVVGAVPALPWNGRQKSRSKNVPDGYWKRVLSESIDGIRTMLLCDASREANRVIMVSSALAREGKTTLASQLAASLARAGRRTLLVDCDLRQPGLHQVFEVPLEPGVCNVLGGDGEVSAVIQKTAVSNLWLIPAGRWEQQIKQALAGDGIRDLVEELRKRFDFVLIDSYPVLSATDSLLIGQCVDSVILSVLRDVSRANHVYAANQKLVSLGIRVLGVVMSGERAAGWNVPRAVAA